MFLVGIGGTMRERSSSEQALRSCMASFTEEGHRTEIFAGPDLDLPMYDPRSTERSARALWLLECVRKADGLVLASPGYHGGVSGLVKNAIDYLEDTVLDDRPYLHDLPVGCIAVAHGYQGAMTTLGALRSIVHALRGWPTPYGAAINAKEFLDDAGQVRRPHLSGLQLIAHQVMSFSEAASAARERIPKALWPAAPRAGTAPVSR